MRQFGLSLHQICYQTQKTIRKEPIENSGQGRWKSNYNECFRTLHRMLTKHFSRGRILEEIITNDAPQQAQSPRKSLLYQEDFQVEYKLQAK